MDLIRSVCLIGLKVSRDEELERVIQARGWTLLTFESATEALGTQNNNIHNSTIYVVNDFEGPDFEVLNKSDKNVNRSERKIIFSPQIMKHHLSEIEEMMKERCPTNGSQLVISRVFGKIFNLKLKSRKICISGVRSREDTHEWNRLVGLIRFMGGEDVKRVEVGTDFLISRTRKAEGDKYRRAVDYDIPVLTPEWLNHVWEKRHQPDFDPFSVDVLARYRIKPFEGLKLAFVNYNGEDLKEMTLLTIANGGEVVEPTDHSCTHIIVDSMTSDKNIVQFNFDCLRNPLSPSIIHQYVLCQDWFWLSIELGGCMDEKRSDLIYPVQGTKNNPGPNASSLSDFRRTRMSIQSLLVDMSFTSFLSPNMSITKHNQVEAPQDEPIVKFDPKTATKRHINCMELFMTEGNYVEILRKMVHEIQRPLEEKKYLDTAEMKIIFGNLLPLLECHENIYRDLDDLINRNWDENNKIGDVFAKHGHSMFRAYSNFVNSFEFSKEMIAKCEEKCQQFRAFLMIARSKCDRQSLQDMFIAPVQRIPRYLLLLKDIQKNTDPSNPDYPCIKAGISKVEQVLTQINENKRKTEGHVMMLDIVNDIDGGAHLLSSKRHFVHKVDVKMILNENGNPTPWRGHPFTLFLFNDVLEVCKKRSIAKSDSITSRNSIRGSACKRPTRKKPYKHIEMIKLCNISYLYEVEDDDDDDKMFFIKTKDYTEDRSTFKLFPFQHRSSDSFIPKLKCYLMSEKENEFKEESFKTVPSSSISDFDFTHADYLASTVSKSSFGRAKTKLSRTFSMSRRHFLTPNPK